MALLRISGQQLQLQESVNSDAASVDTPTQSPSASALASPSAHTGKFQAPLTISGCYILSYQHACQDRIYSMTSRTVERDAARMWYVWYSAGPRVAEQRPPLPSCPCFPDVRSL